MVKTFGKKNLFWIFVFDEGIIGKKIMFGDVRTIDLIINK